MTNNQEYIYSFPNTSCTLRAVAYLRNRYQAYLDSVAVINLIDRWLVRLNVKNSLPHSLAQDLHAFLSEMGSVTQPPAKILKVLACLDRGETPTEIMNRERVVIVTYGKPETEEIEIFRDRVIDGLGYCPQNMI